MRVLGRRTADGAAGWLGHYRAWDGSAGERVGVDLDGPHAVAVVGKRGSGKSYTLGVLAEELRATAGVVPVVLDPMGALGDLPGADSPPPRVRADAVPARAWPDLLGLDPPAAPGRWSGGRRRPPGPSRVCGRSSATRTRPGARSARPPTTSGWRRRGTSSTPTGWTRTR